MIRTSVEGARGCGYRKEGGLYLVAPELSEACSRLPAPLHTCPTCGAGIKPARSWTWVNPAELVPAERHGTDRHNAGCPLGWSEQDPARLTDTSYHRAGNRAGLLWIGEAFYKTAVDFAEEAARMGVSRRIKAVPNDFVLGETYVLMAHRKAIPTGYEDQDGNQYETIADAVERGLPGDALERTYKAGVVTLFKPTAIEYIVKPDEEADEELHERLRKRGIEPVKVVRAETQPLPI